jgi:alkylated DNA nucleotide flippase Atl1
MASHGSAEVSDYVSQVLDVAESIPAGRVMAYGDIAEFLGQGGPRQVGRVMALWGGAVPWWRVVRADGRPLRGHEAEAVARYRAEGTPLHRGGARLDMGRARWVPTGA